jgi:ribonuclease PH
MLSMPTTRRHDGRKADQLREVTIEPGFVSKADGSCLIEVGGTRVICTASLAQGVPEWREASALGWVTAEYGMLPASTGRRRRRPVGKLDGRSVEIQRLIGRSLRAVTRFDKLGLNTVYLDCDVLEADGGTRTAAITGAQVALALAVHRGAEDGRCEPKALDGAVAAVSVGVVAGRPVLDLDYAEDSTADVDMNVVMTGGGKFIEVQGTSEGSPFDNEQLTQMLALASRGIRRLIRMQREVIREVVS